jgi:hypothetical protein
MSKVTIAGDVNGSGVFTIAAPNGNTNRTLTLPDAAGTIDTLQRAGNVLQVVSTTSTTVTSTTSGSYVDISGLSLSITPTSATSKILIVGSVNYSNATTTQNTFFRLMRDAVSIGNGNTDICFGGRMGTTTGVQTGGINHLDAPATTSATTYKFQFSTTGSSTGRVNERGDTGNDYSSHITLMEIAA